MNIELIATKIIKQAEGALSILYDKKVTISKDIENLIETKKRAVIAAVEISTGYSLGVLKMPLGTRDKSLCKHLLMYYLHNYAAINKYQISKIVEVDHTNVQYGINKVNVYLSINDQATVNYVKQINEILGL